MLYLCMDRFGGIALEHGQHKRSCMLFSMPHNLAWPLACSGRIIKQELLACPALCRWGSACRPPTSCRTTLQPAMQQRRLQQPRRRSVLRPPYPCPPLTQICLASSRVTYSGSSSSRPTLNSPQPGAPPRGPLTPQGLPADRFCRTHARPLDYSTQAARHPRGLALVLLPLIHCRSGGSCRATGRAATSRLTYRGKAAFRPSSFGSSPISNISSSTLACLGRKEISWAIATCSSNSSSSRLSPKCFSRSQIVATGATTPNRSNQNSLV